MTVGKIEAVEALFFNKLHQASTTESQLIQQESVWQQQHSTSFNKYWNLVRDQGSEVQILSPRPRFLKAPQLNA